MTVSSRPHLARRLQLSDFPALLRCRGAPGRRYFLWLLSSDGAFSFVDEATTLAVGSSPLSGVRAAFALAVLVMSIPMAAIIGVTPKAPKRVLVPPILFAWWAGPAWRIRLGSGNRHIWHLFSPCCRCCSR